MALPNKTTIEAAAASLYTALTEFKAARPVAQEGIVALEKALSVLSGIYSPKFTQTVTDSAQANLAALFPVLAVSLGDELRVGDVFIVTGTGDTTDNALAAAKGGAVAANDVFAVTNVGTPAVVYVGSTAVSFAAQDLQSFNGVV